jgi:hypothetical protein
MALKFPKYITFKRAYAPSAISRLDPENLTPTMKLTLSRARIWGDIIGGNKATGSHLLKKQFIGPAMVEKFNFAIRDFYMPFSTKSFKENETVNRHRAERTSRKGKAMVSRPKMALSNVPKYERKRFLYQEEIRRSKGAN